jgi:hypothetical protein
LLFRTTAGIIKLSVEAYVVKGMSTDFILGNDFADQYDLSIIRKEGRTMVQFGKKDYKVEVVNSISSFNPYLDEDGHTFKVLTRPEYNIKMGRSCAHRKAQNQRKQRRRKLANLKVRACFEYTIQPHTNQLIQIEALFPEDRNDFVVERGAFCNSTPHELYAVPESLISRESPFLWISNFSSLPITISRGQIIGRLQDPRSIYSTAAQLSSNQRFQLSSYASLIQNFESHYSIAERSIEIDENRQKEQGLAQNQPIEGGPKTTETPESSTPANALLKEVDISSNLTEDQLAKMSRVLLKNSEAFALDGRLGSYNEEVEIPVLEHTKPISIPPYPMSPANREIIDKQMDSWLKLGVIEASWSPWAAPVFIVHQNGKPRMVIDLRRLNENVIPDEFPLPRQEDILQTLSGSRYLSTLDALSGFTQLSVKSEDREKLAFRTHRGLFHFKRMPFGYRNGPAVFQRVMQSVLSPFLWIFALVYIDDIVIFSKTFDDHLTHIDSVLKAIGNAQITLSPSKCHFGYESLLLLGQKVSRLGLSTHKEKVDAILDLEAPKNVHDLQVFLGMMVYFSSYIPFYAWIVHPLFQLLKRKKEWKWGEEEEHTFKLCKEVLSNAPVRAHAIPGQPYRVYSDACDYALAAILQQVQLIQISDLKGTKVYDKLRKAWDDKEDHPPLLCTHLTKENSDVPADKWGSSFDTTTVHVERVIAYWSRVLQPAERNYSPTEREALALKEGLIKFQPLIEGERIYAITDHAALTWSKTFQNVN